MIAGFAWGFTGFELESANFFEEIVLVSAFVASKSVIEPFHDDSDMPYFIVGCHGRRNEISCLVVFCELTIEPPAEAIGDGDVFFVRFFIFVLLGIGGYCDEAMETVDT